MKIFLTGGTGIVGKTVVRHLMSKGHDVFVIAKENDTDVAGINYKQCDITDYQQLKALMKGYEAIVHLAAYRSPMGVPGREVFHVNDCGTFCVYEAAAENGIKRIVSASSINVLGSLYGRKMARIKYFPVDESHPVSATDAYSFSKQILENIADYFYDREGISGCSLRLPAVIGKEEAHRYNWKDRIKTNREYVRRLLNLPERERQEELHRLNSEYERMGREGFHEQQREQSGTRQWGLSDDEIFFMRRKAILWSWIDDRDSARAIEKALVEEYGGSHAFYIASKHNVVNSPIKELAKLYLPQIKDIRPTKEGENSLISIQKAREIIGFEPKYNRED